MQVIQLPAQYVTAQLRKNMPPRSRRATAHRQARQNHCFLSRHTKAWRQTGHGNLNYFLSDKKCQGRARCARSATSDSFFKSRGWHFHVRRGADDHGRNRVIRHEAVRPTDDGESFLNPSVGAAPSRKMVCEARQLAICAFECGDGAALYLTRSIRA